VSASVNFPLHNKVQKFSSGTGSPGWSQKKGRKTVVCVCACNAANSRVNMKFTTLATVSYILPLIQTKLRDISSHAVCFIFVMGTDLAAVSASHCSGY